MVKRHKLYSLSNDKEGNDYEKKEVIISLKNFSF